MQRLHLSPTLIASRAFCSAVALTLLCSVAFTQILPTDVSVCTAARTFDNPEPHPSFRCAISAVPGPAHIPECATHDHFGSTLAAGGDFNGDGQPDLLIGGSSQLNELGESSQAWLFLGNANTPSVTFDGNGHTDLFGSALCFLPDINGDGMDEIAVGAPNSSTTGRVFVFFGREASDDPAGQRQTALSSAAVILQGAVNGGRFGAAMAAGDMDGDGLDDLIIGAPGSSDSDTAGFPGSVSWFSGSDLLGTSSTAENSPRLLLSSRAKGHWTGLLAADRFGHSVTAAGELDGQPGVEILVGAPQVDPTVLKRLRGATGSGYAQILSADAPTPTLQFGPLDNDRLPLQFGEGFGAAVAAGRDLNNDGVPDLAIGAPLFLAVTSIRGELTAGSDNGRVWFFSGADGRPLFASPPATAETDPPAGSPRLVSRDPTAQLGWSLAFVDDATGDGFADLVVGARGESSLPTACPWNRKLPVGDAVAGAIHVIDGRTGRSVTRITGIATLDLLGQAIAAYDMDGDSLSEVFSSAASWAPKGGPPSRAEQGRAYMMRGVDIAKP
ncbi:MAG: hypothetical protein ACI9EF_000983 [Pseudohongiellaceae bacterium]|jgi:hypothetical protein